MESELRFYKYQDENMKFLNMFYIQLKINSRIIGQLYFHNINDLKTFKFISCMDVSNLENIIEIQSYELIFRDISMLEKIKKEIQKTIKKFPISYPDDERDPHLDNNLKYLFIDAIENLLKEGE